MDRFQIVIPSKISLMFPSFQNGVLRVGDTSVSRLGQLEKFLGSLRSRTLAAERIERGNSTKEEEESYCCICYTCEPDARFKPCHHISCHGCITRHLLNSTRCFFCNATVIEVVWINEKQCSASNKCWGEWVVVHLLLRKRLGGHSKNRRKWLGGFYIFLWCAMYILKEVYWIPEILRCRDIWEGRGHYMGSMYWDRREFCRERRRRFSVNMRCKWKEMFWNKAFGFSCVDGVCSSFMVSLPISLPQCF